MKMNNSRPNASAPSSQKKDFFNNPKSVSNPHTTTESVATTKDNAPTRFTAQSTIVKTTSDLDFNQLMLIFKNNPEEARCKLTNLLSNEADITQSLKLLMTLSKAKFPLNAIHFSTIMAQLKNDPDTEKSKALLTQNYHTKRKANREIMLKLFDIMDAAGIPPISTCYILTLGYMAPDFNRDIKVAASFTKLLKKLMDGKTQIQSSEITSIKDLFKHTGMYADEFNQSERSIDKLRFSTLHDAKHDSSVKDNTKCLNEKAHKILGELLDNLTASNKSGQTTILTNGKQQLPPRWGMPRITKDNQAATPIKPQATSQLTQVKKNDLQGEYAVNIASAKPIATVEEPLTYTKLLQEHWKNTQNEQDISTYINNYLANATLINAVAKEAAKAEQTEIGSGENDFSDFNRLLEESISPQKANKTEIGSGENDFSDFNHLLEESLSPQKANKTEIGSGENYFSDFNHLLEEAFHHKRLTKQK